MAHIPVFPSRDSSRSDATMFLVFVPCFLVLLAVAVLGLLVGIPWKGWMPGAENMGNVFSGTRAAVYTLLSHIN